MRAACLIRAGSALTGAGVQPALPPFVGLVDHPVFVQHLGHQGGEVHGLRVQLLAAAVAPGQEQQLLHQRLHVLGLGLDGGDGLLQHLLVVLAPAVQHLHIALDHRDGGAQLVGGVGDELGLLAVGGVHAGKHAVDGVLQPLQVLVAGGQPVADVDLADGLLQVVELRLVHAAVGLHHARLLGPLRRPARAVFVGQALGGLGDLVQGLQQPPGPLGAAEEAQQPAHALHGQQRLAEQHHQPDEFRPGAPRGSRPPR